MKKIINSHSAPAPIGPYNQAVQAGAFLFISGQIPLNPKSGEMADKSIDAEAYQVMNNIEVILKEANMDFSDVVKTTIFLTDMEYFAGVNDIYARYFSLDFPARETIAVKALPKGARVEISAIAYKVG